MKPLILCFLAFFAAFRRIQKLFVAEEYLFANRPDELLGTIYTGDRKILKSVDSFGTVVGGRIDVFELSF